MRTVVPVSNKKQLAAFIDFPHHLYENDHNYVPELFIAQRDLLTKHPFHKHSETQLFLGMHNGKITGRIAAILNNNHNSFNKSNDGFFGFFDVEEDPEMAALLFREAVAWLKTKGVATIIGPTNFSTNDTCGVLIEGYNSPPVAMMTYNRPYYADLIERNGFGKKTDLIAYSFGDKGYSERSLQLQGLLKQRLERRGVVIRPVNKKDFDNEVERVHKVYNAAWDKNLGFVPMTRQEFAYLAKDLKMVLDPDFCLIAEHEGNTIGFALAIPDINQVLIKIKKGRLFPLGIFKLLLNLKKIDGIRVIALGVVEGYRKMGIEGCFYASIIEAYRKKKFKRAEASWVLEENELMNKAILDIEGKPYKRYRIYEKRI